MSNNELSEQYKAIRELFANGEATPMLGETWAVRPKGTSGTCGWVNGVAWNVQYVTASNETSAVIKAAAQWS